MSSKTRLYVIKSKELIYTTLFVVVALVLVILMVCMFLPDKNNKKSSNKNKECYIIGKFIFGMW